MPHHRKRPDSLLPYVLLAGLAGWAVMLCRRAGPAARLQRADGGRRLAAISSRAAAEAGEDDCFVRPAGRGAMRDPPRRWDMVDESSDESFPASDPPGNY